MGRKQIAAGHSMDSVAGMVRAEHQRPRPPEKERGQADRGLVNGSETDRDGAS